MNLSLIIVVILIIALIGSFPAFPYNQGWGYYPSGILGTVLTIVLILWLLGRL